jgi:hypothetical protein
VLNFLCQNNNNIFITNRHGNPKIFDIYQINPRVGLPFGELYRKTLEKTDFIKRSGYNLVEIWENDWKKFISSIQFIQKIWRKKKLKNIRSCETRY